MALFYAVHVYDLKPEVSQSEFERFMEREWIPYVSQKKGCQGAMLLKGYVGEWTAQRMDYATIEIWESHAANRAAWGGPRSTWVTPADLKPFMDRFQSYVIPATFRTYEFELVA